MRAFLLFGGGVQTVALAALVAMRDERLLRATGGALPDLSVMADTGDEDPETWAYLDMFRPWLVARGGRLEVVSCGTSIYDDTLAAATAGLRCDNPPVFTRGADGKAAPMARACTQHYKIAAANRLIRSMLGPAERCEKWFGISLDEVQRSRTSDEKWADRREPLIDMKWHRVACGAYLESIGLPIPPKSACVICPYRNDDSWGAMKAKRPASFERACRFDDGLRDGPGFKGATSWPGYLHRSLRPLRTLTFAAGQGRFFGEESCDGGYCMT